MLEKLKDFICNLLFFNILAANVNRTELSLKRLIAKAKHAQKY